MEEVAIDPYFSLTVNAHARLLPWKFVGAIFGCQMRRLARLLTAQT